jgi:CubicO group peptidase (beta-lactamase class C family)
MFTAVAVGQLVEQGKLAFGDTLARLLPDRPLDAAERMTVHHLLTHTSGLGDFFGPRFDSGGKDRLHTVWDYLALFEDAPVAFEPGSQFSYSNAGFVVLGAVVERVSGLDYFEYVRQRVYGPSGMRDSDSFERDAVVPNLAVGYTNFFSRGPEPGPARPNTETLPSRGGPAGGGYSTTGDLLRFADALLGHTLVGPEMTGLLTSGKVDTGMGPGARYGYGFLDERFRGARVVGHNGGAPGINATLNIYPDAGLTVALMANVDAGVMHPERHLRDVLTA